MQLTFEKFCIFCDKYEHLFPLQFILGFYVTQVLFTCILSHTFRFSHTFKKSTNNCKKVIARWWLQFDAIVWPDKLAMDLAAFLPGSGKPRQVLL